MRGRLPNMKVTDWASAEPARSCVGRRLRKFIAWHAVNSDERIESFQTAWQVQK